MNQDWKKENQSCSQTGQRPFTFLDSQNLTRAAIQSKKKEVENIFEFSVFRETRAKKHCMRHSIHVDL